MTPRETPERLTPARREQIEQLAEAIELAMFAGIQRHLRRADEALARLDQRIAAQKSHGRTG